MSTVQLSTLGNVIAPAYETQPNTLVQSAVFGRSTPDILGSGEWFANQPTSAAWTGSSLGADRIDIAPMFFAANVTVDRLAVITHGGHAAGREAKILIYNSDADGKPSTLFHHGVALDCTTAGTKEEVVDLTFEANKKYWFGVVSNHASLALKCFASTVARPLNSADAGSDFIRCVSKTSSFATPISPWVYDKADYIARNPIVVRMRIA